MCDDATADLRVCVDCNISLPLDQFHKMPTGKDGLARCCKSCASIRHKRWRKANPHRQKTIRRKADYGLSSCDYNRLVMEQEGRCLICNELPSDTRGLVIDHCHRTGCVRGLLCGNCNTAIGMMKEDAVRLSAAAVYVGRWQREAELRLKG